jgi:uncharacterized membrane protein YeaQ/YmgE (transglycosylase-associated protein family)
MFSIIGWLIIGGLAGWIASMIAGTNAQQGWLMNIVVGILGAFIGGFLFSLLTGSDFMGGFNLVTLVVATLGAVVLLFLYRAVSGRGATSRL